MKKDTTHRAASTHRTASKKRDAILKGMKVSTAEVIEGLDEAQAVLAQYVKDHKKRNTPERNFILKKIYQLSVPVNAETLHQMLVAENTLVSLSTVYYTLQLLQEVHLIKRIELVEGLAFYEKVYGSHPHIYMVCQKCGCVTIVDKPNLFDDVQKNCPRGFHVSEVTVIVGGLCHKCQSAIKKAEQRKQAKIQQTTITTLTTK